MIGVRSPGTSILTKSHELPSRHVRRCGAMCYNAGDPVGSLEIFLPEGSDTLL